MTPHKIRIVHLGFALIMVFLLTPIWRRSKMDRIGILDWVMAAAAFAVFAASFIATTNSFKWADAVSKLTSSWPLSPSF